MAAAVWTHTTKIVSKNVCTVRMLKEYVLIYLLTHGCYLARLNSVLVGVEWAIMRQQYTRSSLHRATEWTSQLLPGWSVNRSSELLCYAVLCSIVVMRVYIPVHVVAWSAGAPRVTCIEVYQGTCLAVKCQLLVITWGIASVALLGTVLILPVLICVLNTVLLHWLLYTCAGCFVP